VEIKENNKKDVEIIAVRKRGKKAVLKIMAVFTKLLYSGVFNLPVGQEGTEEVKNFSNALR